MTERFGSGIHLNSNDVDGFDWDLDVDESGDLRSTSGLDELQKDVAFRSAQALEDVIGHHLTPTAMNRVRSTIRDVLETEDRIKRIVRMDVSRVGGQPNTVRVRADVNTESDVVSLVFTAGDE